MNKLKYIEQLLSLLPSQHNDIFNKMYPNGLAKDQVKWATTQVENSVKGVSRELETHKKVITTLREEVVEHETTNQQLSSDLIFAKTEIRELKNRVLDLSADPETLDSEATAKRLRLLDALEAGGVDNWEWYGESIEAYENVEDS